MYKEKTTTKRKKINLKKWWFVYGSEIIKGVSILIFFVTFISAIAIFFVNVQKNADIKTYNNGICTQCGGEYKIFSKEHEQYNYKCEDCDYIITTHTQMEFIKEV